MPELMGKVEFLVSEGRLVHYYYDIMYGDVKEWFTIPTV